MKQEVYISSTMGEIPLSFTGRRLLQNLREAIEEMTIRATNAARAGHGGPVDNWKPVSEARGRLAKYISELEQRTQLTDYQLVTELYRRMRDQDQSEG